MLPTFATTFYVPASVLKGSTRAVPTVRSLYRAGKGSPLIHSGLIPAARSAQMRAGSFGFVGRPTDSLMADTHSRHSGSRAWTVGANCTISRASSASAAIVRRVNTSGDCVDERSGELWE